MLQFQTVLKRFAQQGEKTGWTYFELSAEQATALLPGNRRSFRVKGKLDELPIAGVATIPMGDGNFIIAVNTTMRKTLRKKQGDMITVRLQLDKQEVPLSPALLECLQDEPDAQAKFKALPRSHQHYYSRWIESAKTDATKARRIAQAINGFLNGRTFAEIMKADSSRE
ncbi:MAG: hypothetical protein JWP27_305 [Flaviaesturariibacter sp.]|nr:hypothetical protein [Flaviaesturariibacter sp.]